MSSSPSISQYFGNIRAGLMSTLAGMRITIGYFFKKGVTVQYPEECMPIAPRYRGLHYLDQDLCIACRACEKACPVDCIEIRFEKKPGKVNDWIEFSVDYNKCMFCELCCMPCPSTCIHMGNQINLIKTDRSELVHDLLTWTGMRDVDHTAIKDAEEAKKKKAEAAAAKKAKAAEAKKADEDKGEG